MKKMILVCMLVAMVVVLASCSVGNGQVDMEIMDYSGTVYTAIFQ